MSSSRVVELTQRLAESAAVNRESYAAMVSIIAEMQDANIVHGAGYSRLTMLISDVARFNTRVAGRLIRHAEATAEVITPEFLPPRWIDPQQVPRRNLLHTRQ